MDISALCRSCMKEVNSWEKGNFDKRTIDMFCYCTNVQITEDDKLPKQFCYDCFIKIESSYTFVKEAQKVNILIRNIISRSQTSVIIESDGPHRAFNVTDFDPNSNASNLSLLECELNTNMRNFNEKSLFRNIQEESQCQFTADDTQSPSKPNSSLKSLNHNEPLLVQGNGEKNFTSMKTESVENVHETEQTHTVPVEMHCCAICRKSFTDQSLLETHMAEEHQDWKYTCEHCSKTFRQQSQLQRHVSSHSEERKFSCNTCPASFRRKKHLTAHARAHSDERPHVCQECGLSFKLKSVLKTHLQLHDPNKRHLCSVCGWAFAQAGNLEVHMRRHSGEKPYKCRECPFACSVSSSLARHRSRHRGAPRHVCRHCRRAFYDASGLARHTRSHTGEQPYKCPCCARAFVDSWKRKSHLMRAHNFALRDIPALPRDPGPLDMAAA